VTTVGVVVITGLRLSASSSIVDVEKDGVDGERVGADQRRTDLIAIQAGVEWILGGQHGAADEYTQQNDVTVVRMIAQLVTPDTKPAHVPQRTCLITSSTSRHDVTSSSSHRSRLVQRCGEIKLRVFTTATIYVHPSMVLIFHQSFTRFTPFVKPTSSASLYTFPSQTVGTCLVHRPHVKHIWSVFVSFQPCVCVTLVYCSQKYKWIELVTFRVRRSRGEMYIGHGHMCAYLSVPRRIPTLLHGP